MGEDVEPCFEGSNISTPTIQFSFDDGFKEQLFSMINELKDLLNKGGAKVFTKYSVVVGDTLWNNLYNFISKNYTDYSIESVCEEEEQVFAVLVSDGKYYRLNFSLAENGEYEFTNELTEIESYTPDETPQFAADAVAEYIQKLSEDEEKCPKCGKPIKECSCDEDKKDKYELSEIPEYVELENKFSELEAKFSELTKNYETLLNEKKSLETENYSLVEFKTKVEKKEKEAMIKSFYMLTDEDKADVITNIDTYSLDEIEAKLSIICVRNKVNFNLDEDNQKPDAQVVFNLDDKGDDDATTPAWVKAALQVAKTMN